MTCIVALKHDGKIYMGGDSAVSRGWERRLENGRKTFRLGEMLIGTCGSVRMSQLLQHQVSIPHHHPDIDNQTYMVRDFAETIRTCFKSYGYATIESNRETGGQFLVGYRGGIYCVESDFSIGTYTDQYDAIGCGMAYALGAMAAQPDDTPPETRVLKALEISGQFSNAVAAPYYVEVL